MKEPIAYNLPVAPLFDLFTESKTYGTFTLSSEDLVFTTR
ncbi:8067_t:CDS:2 [Entrophospora sp. SA101]|nr:8067_t:CDS:2 [Entrophospora sp. SA101]